MENLKQKKIMVTGSSGFFGKALVKKLKQMNLEYFPVNRKNYDLAKEEDMYNLFNDIKPDIVFHLAADCGGIAYNIKNPANITHNNLIMSLNLFKTAIKFNNPKIIIIGSADSYPVDAKIPYNEDDIWKGFPNLTSGYYGMSKRMNLVLGETYYKQYGLSSIHTIFMNLYGPNDHFDEFKGHVIPAIIKKMNHAIESGNENIEIFGDGSPIREFIYVEDAAEILIQSAINLDGFKYFNVGSGQLYKIWDVLQLIKKEMNFKGDFIKDLSQPMGHKIKHFNLEKMNSLLDYHNFTSFEEGIKNTVDWFKNSNLTN
jgi:nucleoside-diphosphate-sugar epimerase